MSEKPRKQEQPNAPATHLVVVHPFDDYARGHVIDDVELVEKVLNSDNVGHVNKVLK